ncbi:MAG: MotA/TolQ/ExbB proton channel family protein [Gemmatimonadaceae bacterium]|nr:MotA/TolQ/ExbB proton channel family protein [Gemmatimonadaceae bacterium]
MPLLALLQLQPQPTSTIFGLLAHGTPVSWLVLLFLLCLSAVSWTIMAMKYREFRAVSAAAEPLLDYIPQADSFEDAALRAKLGLGSPFYAVLRRAEKFMLDTRPAIGGSAERQARLSQAQVEALQMLLDKEATGERDRLERLLPWLATIGAVSPLIGLLGTVLGVINAFLGVAASGSGNISAVAPGVAEALIATALALTVAIPAVFGYNYFANRLNHLTGEIDAFSTDVVALLVRDGRI